jgi:flavorubredoxin
MNMIKPKTSAQNDESLVEIGEGIYWVGFYDAQSGLHCNPYLIVDHDEALVVDGGSRPDFATVMMKIMQTGIAPKQIQALVYQHYDPDLCGSIPNFEDIIAREDLKIISDAENLMFIRHYSAASRLVSLSKLKFEYTFSSGRKIHFTKTPYAHAAGSFVTFDPKTKVLFTSDLFGSYGKGWELYLRLTDACRNCRDYASCARNLPDCPVAGILHFHKKIMTSTRALRYALEIISKIPFEIIAPQHGSVIKDTETIKHVLGLLGSLENVGIDEIISEDYEPDVSSFDPRSGSR